MKNTFLFDVGGDTYGGGQSSPVFTNGLDSNLWLANVQHAFVEYLEARIAVTNIISKIGGNLAEIAWYAPLKYNLFWNDAKNDIFVGTRKDRQKSIQGYGVNFVMRLDVIGGSEDRICIGVKEEHVEVAVVVAESLQVMEPYGITIPPVDILFPNGYVSTTTERTLHRDIEGLSLDKCVVVSVLLQLNDKGTWVDVLNNDFKGIIAWLSASLDRVAEGKHE